MGLKLIGREEEQKILQRFLDSSNPEFLAIYGRRRIGKTFLVKKFFEHKKCTFFSVTGIQNGTLPEQINRFVVEISNIFYGGAALQVENNWWKCFDLLYHAIKNHINKNQRIVLFIDEIPWMATHRSKLLLVLEYFWNQYWSFDPRIKLIICGSSASWIIRKIINNKGGLHNGITKKILLEPFGLLETKLYLSANGVKLSNQHISEIYMVTGGIPYYLSEAKKGLSATQNIEELAFKKNSLLYSEFDNLFSSLFDDPQPYIEILSILSTARYGLSQEELIRKSKTFSRGGTASYKLKELEDAGFIMSFIPYGHNKRGIYFRIIDEYTQFYFKWIEPVKKTLQKQSLEAGYWEKMKGSPAWHSWSGYAFEAICYKHIPAIRKKLGINAGAIANVWRFHPKPKSKENGAQIDLLFDRTDDAITLCEIKYSNSPFVIDKEYAKNLINKRDVFLSKTQTKKQIFITMITANGLKNNFYAEDLIHGVVLLDSFFEP